MHRKLQNKMIGDRSFTVAGLRLWYNVLVELQWFRAIVPLLKMFLFD